MSNASINLDELEQLLEENIELDGVILETSGMWVRLPNDANYAIAQPHNDDFWTAKSRAELIASAINALPELIARIRELEAQNNQLLGVIGSMKNIMCERNRMVISLVTGLHQTMDRQVQEVMDKSLVVAIDAIQEELNK